MERLLTLKETAVALRMSTAWMHRKLKSGQIKYVWIGHKRFISPQEIERILTHGLQKRETNATSENTSSRPA